MRRIKIYVRIKFYKIEFFLIFFYSTYLYPIFFFDHCYNIFYTDQQEMNKLNNQKWFLHSVLLSLSILLTLLFIATCTGVCESGNLTKPVRKSYCLSFCFFSFFGKKNFDSRKFRFEKIFRNSQLAIFGTSVFFCKFFFF